MSQEHILVVDDNEMVTQMMQVLLARLGYAVTLKTSPIEALNWLRMPGNLPDLIISDVMMPELSGQEFIRHVRSDPLAAHLPIILLTDNKEMDAKIADFEAGADDYLVKPVDPTERDLRANALQGNREEYLAAGMDDYISKPVQVDELVRVLSRCQLRADASQNGQNKSRPASATLDRRVLEQLQAQFDEDGPAIIAELIGAFLENAPKLLTEFQQGLRHGDAGRLHRTAHTLKPNSAAFGALNLSALCANLEKQAKAGSIEEAKITVARIRQELSRVQQELRRYVEELEISRPDLSFKF